MNRKGLMGWLVLIGLVVLVVMGVTVYFSFRQTGVSLHTGDLKFSVDYEPEESIDEDSQIVEVAPDDVALPGEVTINVTENNNSLIGGNFSE